MHFITFDPSKHFKCHLIIVISSSMSDWSKAIPTLFPLWRFFIVPTNYEVEMIVCISLIHFWSHRIKKRKSKIAFHLFSFFHCHPMCRCFCLGKLNYRSFLVELDLVPISSLLTIKLFVDSLQRKLPLHDYKKLRNLDWGPNRSERKKFCSF